MQIHVNPKQVEVANMNLIVDDAIFKLLLVQYCQQQKNSFTSTRTIEKSGTI